MRNNQLDLPAANQLLQQGKYIGMLRRENFDSISLHLDIAAILRMLLEELQHRVKRLPNDPPLYLIIPGYILKVEMQKTDSILFAGTRRSRKNSYRQKTKEKERKI